MNWCDCDPHRKPKKFVLLCKCNNESHCRKNHLEKQHNNFLNKLFITAHNPFSFQESIQITTWSRFSLPVLSTKFITADPHQKRERRRTEPPTLRTLSICRKVKISTTSGWMSFSHLLVVSRHLKRRVNENVLHKRLNRLRTVGCLIFRTAGLHIELRDESKQLFPYSVRANFAQPRNYSQLFTF